MKPKHTGAALPLAVCFLFLPACGAIGGEKKRGAVSTPLPGAKLRTNEWVALEKGGAGRRGFSGLVYLAGEKSWVLMMGYQGNWNDKGPFPYDEETFDLGDRLWRNRFPQGSSWKPEVGPTEAPHVKGGLESGLKGTRLPLYWGGRAPSKAYFQYALDTDRNVVVTYDRRRTLEYDPAKRVWRDLKPKGDPQAGASLPLRWGSLSYDALNREFVLFGGEKGGSEFNDTRTWIYSPAKNEWRRLDAASAVLDPLRARARKLRLEAQRLYGACMARYFGTESAEETRLSLGAMGAKLRAEVRALAAEFEGQGTGREKTQCGWAAEELKRAGALLAKVGDVPNADSLKAGLAAKRLLRRAEHSLLTEPPPRAHSQTVYDPGTKKIVLFGGDRLDMLYADTWTYDCATRKWRERRPESSPSPRAGHAFLYLPKSGKLLLLGGYAFDSQVGYQGSMYRPMPVEAWTYDAAGNAWRFVKRWPLAGSGTHGKKVGGTAPRYMNGRAANLTLAANEDDVLLFAGGTTYACRLDVGGAKAGAGAVKPGSAARRTGPYDPDWYLGKSAPREEAFRAKLAAVRPNTWTEVTGKETLLPRQNRDYGTAAFAPDRDAILWWGGGHSCHCGTDLPVFSMRTGRYYQLYAPGFPLENIGRSGGEAPGTDFLGRPWTPAHTYHSYAYDPVSRRLICCHASRYYAFDPADGNWSQGKLPFGSRVMHLTVCSTPRGPYAWNARGRLYAYDGKRDAWSEVKVGGAKLRGAQCMNSGMCYDSRRNRLIMTHKGFKGDLVAVALETSTASRLTPRGMAGVAANKYLLCRETVYDASRDAVVVAAGWKQKGGGPVTWPVYDCARNAWTAPKVGGRNVCGVSLGLMYDPKREIEVALDANGRVYALKLDLAGSGPSE
jgi:hypothetical protein